MKKLLVILSSLLSLTAFAQQKKVAVYVVGDDAGISKVLGSKLVSAIARSEEYVAIERTAAFLAELSKEQNYQRTGAVDDSELSRLGKQFGVQYICVASVADAFEEKYISTRLIDVESAQVERTASSSGAIQSLDDIIVAANSVSQDLLNTLDKEYNSNSKKVAVYVVNNDAGKEIVRVLGDKLVAGFTNSGRYIAVERTNSFLSQLSKEQNYQRTGVVDDNDISRLGKQFGVQYVCVADISDVFGEKFISARLIDVETAEVVNTHDVGGAMSNMNGCLKMASEIASNLSKGTLKEQAKDARLKEEEKKAEIARVKEEARLRADAEERARIEAEQQKQDVIRQQYGIGYVKLGSFYISKTLYTTDHKGWKDVKNFPQSCHIGGWSDWRFPTESEAQWIRCCFGGECHIYDDIARFFMHNNWKQYEDYIVRCMWLKSGNVSSPENLHCNGNVLVILVRGYK